MPRGHWLGHYKCVPGGNVLGGRRDGNVSRGLPELHGGLLPRACQQRSQRQPLRAGLLLSVGGGEHAAKSLHGGLLLPGWHGCRHCQRKRLPFGHVLGWRRGLHQQLHVPRMLQRQVPRSRKRHGHVQPLRCGLLLPVLHRRNYADAMPGGLLLFVGPVLGHDERVPRGQVLGWRSRL